MKPLFEACKLLIQTHARRLPLIDKDGQTGGEVVLSVLTQYRVLKAISMNVRFRLLLRPLMLSVQGDSMPYFRRPESFYWHVCLCQSSTSSAVEPGRRQASIHQVCGQPVLPHCDRDTADNGV